MRALWQSVGSVGRAGGIAGRSACLHSYFQRSHAVDLSLPRKFGECLIGHSRFAAHAEGLARDLDVQNIKRARAIASVSAEMDSTVGYMTPLHGSRLGGAYCCGIRCARLLCCVAAKLRALMQIMSSESRSTSHNTAATQDSSLTKRTCKAPATLTMPERQGSKRDRGVDFRKPHCVPTVLQPFVCVSVS